MFGDICPSLDVGASPESSDLSPILTFLCLGIDLDSDAGARRGLFVLIAEKGRLGDGTEVSFELGILRHRCWDVVTGSASTLNDNLSG